MKAQLSRRFAAVTASGLGLALVVSACGPPENDDVGLTKEETDCATYEEFGDFTEQSPTVSIYTPITDAEADAFEMAWDPFSECTGIQVEYQGSNDFEAQIEVRVEGGDPPDLAFFPQPGLMSRYQDKLVPASEKVTARAEEGWSEDWLEYGTLDGQLYAPPMSANLKSLVWYSPEYFADNGYEIPETWDELIGLSDAIADDGTKPWCAGIDSGDTTGWPVTDWMEDTLLREADPEVYDQWVNHEIPFDDPRIVDALDKAGSILKNEDYMNGGFGDVSSMTSQSFEEGGYPILENDCALHRQASFYGAQWPDGTDVADDGDISAFYLPGDDADEKPLLGAGEFVAAFSDTPEVEATREFLASDLFHNIRLKTGPWGTAHRGADPESATDDINQLVVESYQDEDAEFRFDASDQMPGHIGSKAFLDEMTEWVKGKSSKEALAAIEDAWDD